MDILYLLIVFPIETLLRWVLLQAEMVSGSFGVALLMLSIVFNLLLLPFYHIAEKVQNKERAIQKQLAPKIREFREVFSGQERHYYLKTLYRQNSYHPIFALRGVLPLAIQVPVFMAAYVLLSDFAPIKGVSFLLIQDLSLPDGLIGGVNLLPFVMTLVNLLAGIIYTKNLSPRETVQIWVVALIFFVILYKSPAALVLYWTFNNIFSLVKNAAYAHVETGRVKLEYRRES